MSEIRFLARRPVRLDNIVRDRLKAWPQRPPGAASLGSGGAWLRGRPCDGEPVAQPYLKIPGSDRMRTIPDGLWLHFAGTAEEVSKRYAERWAGIYERPLLWPPAFMGLDGVRAVIDAFQQSQRS